MKLSRANFQYKSLIVKNFKENYLILMGQY